MGYTTMVPNVILCGGVMNKTYMFNTNNITRPFVVFMKTCNSKHPCAFFSKCMLFNHVIRYIFKVCCAEVLHINPSLLL